VRRVLDAPRVQPKLTVGPPNDAFEREADVVADRVTRMPDPIQAGGRTLQRICTKCEEEMLQQQPIEEEEEELQMRRQPAEEGHRARSEADGYLRPGER
jgi:hypothetical protein